MTDYYKILGVSPIADEKQIRTAYRKLAKKYHPDAGAGSSTATFRAVQDAYDLLSDPEKRREYDQSREAEFSVRPVYMPRHSVRSTHIDLRDVLGSRQGSAKIYAEPLGARPRRDTAGDPWDDLMEYLFRDFWY